MPMLLVSALLLGLVAVGALCWILVRTTARERSLRAELLRLERLAAEVTLNAEAVLDRADERIARLHDLLTAMELQAAEPPAPGRAQAPSSHGRYEQVHDMVRNLARQGKSVDEIAREAGLPRGEVQLVLNLGKKRLSA